MSAGKQGTMAKQTKREATIYAVYDNRGRGPVRVVSSPAVVTAKTVRCLRETAARPGTDEYQHQCDAALAFGYRRVLSLDEADETREAAIQRWAASVQQQLDRAEAEVARCKNLLTLEVE